MRKVVGGELDRDTTRATGRFPGVDIEIVHRPAVEGHGEQISIQVTATPSFEAFGRALETANPFNLWAQSLQVWLDTMRTLSAPWMAATAFPGKSESDSAPSSSRHRSLPR